MDGEDRKERADRADRAGGVDRTGWEGRGTRFFNKEQLLKECPDWSTMGPHGVLGEVL